MVCEVGVYGMSSMLLLYFKYEFIVNPVGVYVMQSKCFMVCKVGLYGISS